MIDKIEVELPCEETGKGCDWIWEDYEEYCDMFCQDCYRYRDWSKAEYVDWNEVSQ